GVYGVLCYFFFQAEDGIRDFHVTGVQTVLFRLMALILIVVVMHFTQSILLPVIFSILISISLFPLARFFERLRLGKAFSAILSVLIAIALISGISWFIVYESIIIGKDASAITDKVLSVLTQGQQWLEDQFGIQRTQVIEKLRQQGEQALGNAGSMISSTF